tara:strand:+ start:85 stop:399 length:315 start_codon:yes stop_codon:yes gene_type:complete
MSSGEISPVTLFKAMRIEASRPGSAISTARNEPSVETRKANESRDALIAFNDAGVLCPGLLGMVETALPVSRPRRVKIFRVSVGVDSLVGKALPHWTSWVGTRD